MGIRAIIFDMDGLLIHTEPLWVQAQIEILSELGADISPTHCEKTTGLRIDEVVAHYHHQSPWLHPSIKEVAYNIARRVSILFTQKRELLEGVHHALDIARSTQLPIALASSSPHFLIESLLRQAQLYSYFSLICSAEDDPLGKPHPAIYIRTAQQLNYRPQDCIAIEDSLFGVIAAKAARLQCIAVPAPAQRADPRYSIADHVLSSLLEISPQHFNHK